MKGAIFDMDGLLLDTERIFQETWREMAAERGVTLDAGFTADVCGNSREGTKSVLARWFPGADTEAFMTEAVRRVAEKETDFIPLKPGTLEILEGMRGAGWALAVASSSPTDMVLRNLRIAGIAPYFDAVVTGPEIVHGKPAPDIFLKACEKAGVQTYEAIVLEDSENGIFAAHNAGIRCICVPDMKIPGPEASASTLAVIDDLTRAYELIVSNG